MKINVIDKNLIMRQKRMRHYFLPYFAFPGRLCTC
jgi:hypothetical protein